MSVLTLSITIAVAAAAAFAGWKAALQWSVRTRDAENEDPRDQEVRELSAALSIARKELAKTNAAQKSTVGEASELQNKMQHANAALSDTQQKYNATKETLNHEIEQREELLEEIRQLRQEIDQARVHATELEVQIKTESHGSGLVAGLDMLDEDGEALAAARERADEFETEATRWKQHCMVMTKTNKALRGDIAALTAGPSDDPERAEINGAAHSAPELHHQHVTPAQTDALSRNDSSSNNTQIQNLPEDELEADSFQKDDLQAIRGIGEKLEQKLHLLGIFSYREIVGINEDMYTRADLVIPGLEQRIAREAWLEQARAQHLEKYNEVI